MVYRKGEMTKAQIDREWPHQVAVLPEFIRGRNHTIIDRFCRGFSLCPRHHYYERNGERYVVYCFADRMEAEFFQMHFDDTLMDPTTRPKVARQPPERSLRRRATPKRPLRKLR